jgi:hypothetical protein
MTEAEWLACDEPDRMLDYLKSPDCAFHSSRKDRLFASACCRRCDMLLSEPRCLAAVEVAEKLADGRLDDWEDQVVAFEDMRALVEERKEAHGGRAALAAGLASVACEESGEEAYVAYVYLLEWIAADDRAILREWGQRAIRCVWGLRPFRPVRLKRAWLTSAVTSLAEAVYDERILPTGELDSARLAVLSDALEEAGCTDRPILDHCRCLGPHVRGCWVVDLILGKQ